MRNRHAKILATIGPASRAPDTLRLLHDVGVDAFRLNFSHGSHEDHAASVKAIRGVQEATGNPICIVADMQGPKLRCGSFEDGKIELRYGETVEIRQGKTPGKPGLIVMPHQELMDAMVEGTVLKFDDGKLQVTVLSNDGKTAKARVDVPGELSERKGINVVNTVLPMSAMTDKDRVDMAFALTLDVDYIALSFVQTSQDVRDARQIIGDKAGIIQRRIIRKCRALGKPVIVATHMLESMIDAPTPTRAEASDVATAIYQGADAVMLSAETAVGRHPATAVAIMDRIISAAEKDPIFWEYFKSIKLPYEATAEDAISGAVRGIATKLNAKAVLGYTLTGSTVQRISRERPPCRILGLTPNMQTASRLALSWGVLPVVTEDPADFDDMMGRVSDLAKAKLDLQKGDTVMISAGVPFGQPGRTNTLNISQID